MVETKLSKRNFHRHGHFDILRNIFKFKYIFIKKKKKWNQSLSTSCHKTVTDLTEKVHWAPQILVVRSAAPPRAPTPPTIQTLHCHHGYYCLTPLAMANRLTTVEHLRRHWQSPCASSHNKDLRAWGNTESQLHLEKAKNFMDKHEGEKGDGTGRVSISSWRNVEC